MADDKILKAGSSADFTEEDQVLTYKPKIEWEEPQGEYIDTQPLVEEGESLDESRNRTEALINGYGRVITLANAIQQKIDKRIETLGGFEVKMDPTADTQTIAAIQRRFPTKDPNKRTYTMYRQALNCIDKQAVAPPSVTADDIKAAKSNPTTANFGGWGNANGANRGELAASSVMKPVDLKKYQENAVLALFKLMEKLIVGAASGEVKNHEANKPHK